MPVQINGRGCYLNANKRLNVVATFGAEMLLVDDTNNAIIPLSASGEPIVELQENISYSVVPRERKDAMRAKTKSCLERGRARKGKISWLRWKRL